MINPTTPFNQLKMDQTFSTLKIKLITHSVMKIFTSAVILKTVFDYWQLTVMTWTKEQQKCISIWQNIKEKGYKTCHPENCVDSLAYAVTLALYASSRPAFSYMNKCNHNEFYIDNAFSNVGTLCSLDGGNVRRKVEVNNFSTYTHMSKELGKYNKWCSNYGLYAFQGSL